MTAKENPDRVCETIDDADGCPEYMRLHADWSRLRWENHALAKALDNCIIILKNQDRSEEEQRVYDYARRILYAVGHEMTGAALNAEER